ncbi:MAG: formylglycine-generating enzyme family protein, partial [Anaerolineae bacterium]|nr:formylglycine-generating enzyme family protein [Anaerolineae bacterium]
AIILAGVRGDPQAVARWIAPAQPEVAYQALTECGVAVDLDTVQPETRAALVDNAHAKTGEANPVGRAAAYRVLGVFDADARSGIGLGPDGLPDIDWVEIPAGPFLMGSTPEQVEALKKEYNWDWPENEKPQHTVELPTYYISRYPITYRQFQVFIDAPDGFHNPVWWDGLLADDEHKQAPGEQYRKYWNHPRENVSWYDAMAFCRWLSAKLGVEVRLPTEAEWEKAARGPDGRIYPYGNEFDLAKGNTSETGIGQTSAVGLLPDGESPYGVLDMSGNVWQWCLTEWRENYADSENNDPAGDARRVVRGGSCFNNRGGSRCAYRPYGLPSSRLRYDGFRVVVLRPPSL